MGLRIALGLEESYLLPKLHIWQGRRHNVKDVAQKSSDPNHTVV